MNSITVASPRVAGCFVLQAQTDQTDRQVACERISEPRAPPREKSQTTSVGQRPPAEVIQPRQPRQEQGRVGYLFPRSTVQYLEKAAGRIASHRIAQQHTHSSRRQSYCDREAQLSRDCYTPSSYYPQSPPRTNRGEEGEDRPASYCTVFSSPANRKRAEDPGEGSAQQHKGSLVMYPWCAQRVRGREQDPAHCLPRRAQQLRFLLCPAFPLCASYLHPQDGKHNTDCAAEAAAAAA